MWLFCCLLTCWKLFGLILARSEAISLFFLACWKLFGLFVAPSEAIWCSSYLLEVVWIVVARSEVTWLFSCLLVLFGIVLYHCSSW